MFPRLGHHGFIGGNDKHDEIDAANAGKHVLDETFVSGHVDEPDTGAVVQIQVGKSDVDGDPAFLLFLEPIGIDAGERPYQCGLAVIDVAGRPGDDISHFKPCRQRRS